MSLSDEQRRGYACKVCGNVPSSSGTLEHGGGCYVLEANGGGSEFVEMRSPMRLITRHTKAAEALGRWEKQYPQSSQYVWAPAIREGLRALGAAPIRERLRGLGDAPRPEDVDRIIGNGSWTEVGCSVCRVVVEEAVEIIHDAETEVLVCARCLLRAMLVIEP